MTTYARSTREGRNHDRDDEKHFSSRERQLGKLAFGPAAARASLRTNDEETVEIAYNGRQKVSALEEKSVE